MLSTLEDPNALIQKDAIHSLVNLSSDDVFNHLVLERDVVSVDKLGNFFYR